MKRAAMLLAYLLVFLLHLSASTCDATSRNRHLVVRADHDATAPSPAIHHHLHHLRHTADVVLSDYGDVHYHPAMMARRGLRGGAAPRPSPGVGGAPPPSLSSAVEPSGVEGAPPPPRKQEASAATEPSPSPMPPPHLVNDGGSGGGEGAVSAAAATEQEESETDDVGVDYAGPRTHPPSSN